MKDLIFRNSAEEKDEEKESLDFMRGKEDQKEEEDKLQEEEKDAFQKLQEEKEEAIREKQEEKDAGQKELKQELTIMEAFDLWDTLIGGQTIRGVLLLIQSFLRKSVVFPSLTIAKAYTLLFQPSEWHQDFWALDRERHIKCTAKGIPFSERDTFKKCLSDEMVFR